MSDRWRKVLFDVLKVLIAGLCGASLASNSSGCMSPRPGSAAASGGWHCPQAVHAGNNSAGT